MNISFKTGKNQFKSDDLSFCNDYLALRTIRMIDDEKI